MKRVETVAHRLTWKLGPMSVQNSEAPLEEHECMKKQMKAGVFCVVKFISERGTADTFFWKAGEGFCVEVERKEKTAGREEVRLWLSKAEAGNSSRRVLV